MKGDVTEAIKRLEERGELTFTPDGRVVLAGGAHALLQWFDRRFAELARETGADAYTFPSLISYEALERAGYMESFPGLATLVESESGAATHALSPAVCYHCYELLRDSRLAQPRTFSCAGRSFRREPHGFEPLARLWEFTMREVVFVGPPAWVVDRRQEWMARIEAFARSCGLSPRFEAATDLFFGALARGQTLLQRLKALKYELRVDLDGPDSALAIASCNLHEDFFGRRFKIGLDDGTLAHSGCVAFGLERWVLAVVTARGREDAAALYRGAD